MNRIFNAENPIQNECPSGWLLAAPVSFDVSPRYKM